MLCLTRKKNERIVIRFATGEEVILMVTEVVGNRVILGFDAPKSVTIHRQEVQEIVDGNPFPCPHCPRRFKLQSALDMHCEAKHSVEKVA